MEYRPQFRGKNENKHLINTVADFERALGKHNVVQNEGCVELTFNLSDSKAYRLFHEFGYEVLARGIPYATSTHNHKLLTNIDESNGETIKILIPIDEVPANTLADLAQLLLVKSDVRYCVNDTHETYRMVLPDDPAYVLVEATEMPWVRVVGNSRYGANYVKPELPEPVDHTTRRNQEFGLGINLWPEGKSILEVRDWLEAQTQAEEKRKLPPTTALPADSVDDVNNQARLWANRTALKSVLKSKG